MNERTNEQTKEQTNERTNDVVGQWVSVDGRWEEEPRKGLRFIHPPFHLSCFGEVEKHIRVMTEINCDGIPIR